MVIIKFEWLKEYKQLEHEIALLEWKLSKSKLELTRWVEGDLMNVRLTNESIASKLEPIIKEYEADLAIKHKQMDELNKIIEALSGTEQHIVKLKYIDGLTLEQIAEELGYTPGYIRYKHANIRKFISFISAYQDEIVSIKAKTND
ncbi:sigma factor-like helix-turn-helix DNA-binding protein [Globicatella sanguinis]|uniref:sigma factor-like helix-turn-helix DNA-binding protein n=1 Tax=Globicatella sanguinis TaxID=13076 RepID=UPI001C3F3901|nr:sigma factor-like helix-turn-helix DNA-binding protein [Globicatella sanguinis]